MLALLMMVWVACRERCAFAKRCSGAATATASNPTWPTLPDVALVQSAPFRYVWPSELDLMARLAGMSLRERWSDWTREPFTSDSRTHVSVWEKTA
jgi:hypothetical protein